MLYAADDDIAQITEEEREVTETRKRYYISFDLFMTRDA